MKISAKHLGPAVGP